MAKAKIEIASREPSDRVRVLELRGQLDQSAEEPLLGAYQKASSDGAQTVILNFREVEAMDSTGLGLLIRLVARAQQQKVRLVACELSAPLQQAFEVTYLDEALDVYAEEAEALQSV